MLSALAFPVKDIVCYAGMTPPATVALSNDTHPESNFLDASQFCLRDLRVCVEWATTLAADIGQSQCRHAPPNERVALEGLSAFTAQNHTKAGAGEVHPAFVCFAAIEDLSGRAGRHRAKLA